MSSHLLLPAFYLPPVSYFHAIKQQGSPVLLLEQHEHYAKQSYRTRAKIATANGILDLIVPIVHGRKEHVPMKDIRINYEHDWQRLHWLSLQTAYRSSPYFEYYEDDFYQFYDRKHDFLFDFNRAQLGLILKCLKMDLAIELTESFATQVEYKDIRGAIHPKREKFWPEQPAYYQVFEERHGFLPDLSVVDLLFNQGPQSKSFL
ncbi:WbqC family protein [Sphingobacterium paludis]|uniref:WbqC-like protein n=1 Tax=Sphingobacterium paludis TaxID=1476465 RepID=A0A4R7CTW1_9SPHI|nr:WbqC family protein [Sphingobacterium paludis]TDS11863.1 WbqC-like protein [Sphingobacterium paludis]